MNRVRQALSLLVLCAAVATGCDPETTAPIKVEKENAQSAGGHPVAVSPVLLKRIYEEDLCLALEPARMPSALGIPESTQIYPKNFNSPTRKSCRFTWEDELSGPSVSIGFDNKYQGFPRAIDEQIVSFKRRQARFDPVKVPGIAGYWDNAKSTLYWFPSPDHSMTLHMGQSKVGDPKKAAAQLVREHLAVE